ncbi:SAM-dependent methyltransferase [Vannielia sp.]|uniref:SAM-dependent methyltransferase n=1 Tax=Vannielia sp. TaxID=2813045 RepID=UPI0026177363|nr:SAM-dependent methyltransferase [Vannielia sp.]MDF1873511.1 SAM-dependent methyltransferase [Vannielia sp.]
MKPPREGEERLGFDPASRADASVHFIGHIRSDWREGDVPRNLPRAREEGGGNARIELNEGFAPALLGLQEGQWIMVLTWMAEARRDLTVQRPRHVDGPRGTFSLRSPARPNPVALGCVQITAIDPTTGTLSIDATDCFDGTPVIDLKPYTSRVDSPQE